MSDVPYFLETRIHQALARVQEVARAKGLTHAFDAELFATQHAVDDLLGAPASDEPRAEGAGTPDGARAAQGVLAKLDELLRRLDDAPDRGPQGDDVPVGRAGRRATGRR